MPIRLVGVAGGAHKKEKPTTPNNTNQRYAWRSSN
jgi:hypothetical protein